ncbi:MAG: AraC family transcriptional regulator [Planctomycetota bacterium]
MSQIQNGVRTSGLWIRESVYPSGTRMIPHEHEQPSLSFILGGKLRESAAGFEEDATTGSLVVKPAQMTHGNLFGPEPTRLLSIVLTDPAILDPDASWLGGVFGGYLWRQGGAAVALGFRLSEGLQDRSEPLWLESLVLDVFDWLTDHRPRGSAPRWVDSVEELIREHCERPPKLEEIAAEFDVHPVYLARAFRKKHGRSIGEYARRLRLERALNDLEGTDEPIARIAIDRGFADQSHLTRDCRKIIGCSPARYRRLMR